MKGKKQFFLVLASLLQAMSYFLPFLDSGMGYEFFGRGVEAFFERGIGAEKWYLFFAFFSPIIFFPILLLAYWKAKRIRHRKLINSFFFVFILLPILIACFVVFLKEGISGEELWGFGAWVISFILFYGLFWVENRGGLEVETELMEHLINDEN